MRGSQQDLWVQGASMSAECGVFDEPLSKDSVARPTINLFEQWEEGAHMPKHHKSSWYPESTIQINLYATRVPT